MRRPRTESQRHRSVVQVRQLILPQAGVGEGDRRTGAGAAGQAELRGPLDDPWRCTAAIAGDVEVGRPAADGVERGEELGGRRRCGQGRRRQIVAVEQLPEPAGRAFDAELRVEVIDTDAGAVCRLAGMPCGSGAIAASGVLVDDHVDVWQIDAGDAVDRVL